MVEILTTALFDRWFDGLRDGRARARVQVRIDLAADGNFGDHKSVGGGLLEMRLDHGPGYRRYYTVRGHVVVILLAGGEKSGQARDIAVAQGLLRQLEGGSPDDTRTH